MSPKKRDKDPVKNRRFIHAKRRAKERYDFNFTKADSDRIIQLIIDQRSKPIKSLSLRKKVHLVHYNNEDILVIYSKNTQTILTLLPKDCPTYREYLENKEQEENKN